MKVIILYSEGKSITFMGRFGSVMYLKISNRLITLAQLNAEGPN